MPVETYRKRELYIQHLEQRVDILEKYKTKTDSLVDRLILENEALKALRDEKERNYNDLISRYKYEIKATKLKWGAGGFIFGFGVGLAVDS